MCIPYAHNRCNKKKKRRSYASEIVRMIQPSDEDGRPIITHTKDHLSSLIRERYAAFYPQ